MSDSERSAYETLISQLQTSITACEAELGRLTRLHAALLSKNDGSEAMSLLAEHARGWLQLIYEAPTSSPCLVVRQIPVIDGWTDHAFELRVGRREKSVLRLNARTEQDRLHLNTDVLVTLQDAEGEYVELFDEMRTSLSMNTVLELDGSKMKALISFHPTKESGLHILEVDAHNTDSPILLANRAMADIRIRYLCARIRFVR